MVIKDILRTILPPGSRQRILAGRLKSIILHGSSSNVFIYKNWIKRIEPKTLSPILEHQSILVSVVVPCYNTPERYIKALIKSLISQTYQNWQLCIADGSTDQALAETIKHFADQDERIVYTRAEGNLGISGNTNLAIKKASGGYVAFLDHDDILPTWSLNEMVTVIKQNPQAGVLYSDEDRLTENGQVRLSPFFKPDWSPDLFLSANYVTHFFMIESGLLKKLGGLRSQYDGSQDYDLMLRALDEKPEIVHVPKILYHMRMAKNSTASTISAKDYVHSSGNQAIVDYLKRNNIKAKVLQMPDRPTNHRIKYELDLKAKVSIIIPFKDKADLLKTCVGSILTKTTHKNYEIILVSNNSTEKKTFTYLNSLKEHKNIKVYKYDNPFNFSAVNNFGRSKASGQVLLFLNNDTKVLNREWLEELAAVALRPEVGEVGALLFYPNNTIQHAGVIVGLLGVAGHVFRELKLGTLTPFWLPDWPRNYLAVTAACVAIEAAKFDKIGGFDEHFITAGQDVRLGIALYEAGYRNVYWPFARLIHYENVSVGAYNERDDNVHDYTESMKYYRRYIEQGDPYFNPNLDTMSEIPMLRRNNG
ncbi:MAG TPA: glycosyltransferase [Candidatus Saccharimonadales bacterium]|jgi:GT2 family glycosyltransferase|nr:glycosyltransferase [Candidatus Saccharimonadales bacterium]